MTQDEEIKLYFDYKSPYAYLAKDLAFTLPERFRIRLRWIPFLLRIKDKGERSAYSEHKVHYSYLDARRWANRRGGLVIRGPRKVYDSRPATLEACLDEAETDRVFGVPLFLFRDEPFWGQDRMGLLDERLTEAGLSRSVAAFR